MLSLTATARSFIARYASPPNMPASAGLRISRRAERRADRKAHSALKVGMATEPEEGDIVVEEEGAKVFCEPVAAERLAGRELDVRKDRDGSAEFVLRNQRCI